MKDVVEDKEVLKKWLGVNTAFEMDEKPVLDDFYQEAARTVAQEVFSCLIENQIRGDLAHLEKRVQIERSGDVNIDSLLLALVAAEENFREDYVRFPLVKMGADRDRAVEVVERAIEAMGGRKRLLEIRAMSAMVWVESSLKELKRPLCQSGVCLTALPVPPYLYPVATWHYPFAMGL